MPFSKKGGKGCQLDVSSKCKIKYQKKYQIINSELILKPINSISILITESSESNESKEATIILSSDSFSDSNESIQVLYIDNKLRYLAIAYQFTNILLSPLKSE